MKDIGGPSDFARPFGFQADGGAQEGLGHLGAGLGRPGVALPTGDFSASARFGQLLDAAGAQMLQAGETGPEQDETKAADDDATFGSAVDPCDGTGAGDTVLLAMATMPATQTALSPFDVGFLSEPSSPTSRAAALCDRIGLQVERALKAEYAPVAGRPITIDIPPSDAVPGLDAFTLTVTPAAIEVVLIINASPDQARATFEEASNALADRLRTRFGKRMVRIFAQKAAAPHQALGTGEA